MSEEQKRTLLHSCEIPVRWGDMDAYGHVNNALYLRYLEEARVQFLRELGSDLEGSKLAPVVINVGCTFLRPVNYPATLIVKSFVTGIGRSSFMIEYEVATTVEPDVICSEGYSKVVWMDHDTGKSVPLPDDIRNNIT